MVQYVTFDWINEGLLDFHGNVSTIRELLDIVGNLFSIPKFADVFHLLLAGFRNRSIFVIRQFSPSHSSHFGGFELYCILVTLPLKFIGVPKKIELFHLNILGLLYGFSLNGLV